MSNATLAHVLRHLRQLADSGGSNELTDGELLEHFRTRREEAAFAVLVQRLGPLVLGVCRRVLGDAVEAEDAFQATFLVLVRRAAAVRKQDSLASFLYGVAYRVALKARTQAGARRALEQRASNTMQKPQALNDMDWQEVLAILDDEISRLPEVYRVPVVLCYLQGKTQATAAQEIGCPRSSLASRLDRARIRLRKQLTRRGVTLGGVLLTAVLTAQAEAKVVPAGLLLATTRVARLMVAGKVVTAGPAAAPAVALADHVLKTLSIAKSKLAAMLVLVAVIFATSAGVLARQSTAEKSPQAPTPADPTEQAGNRKSAAPKADAADSLPPGAIARLGTLRFRHDHTVSAVAYSRDGKVIVSGSWDCTVRIWDADTGAERMRFGPHDEGVSTVAISPDGSLVASGAMDSMLRFWDITTGKEIFKSPELENTVISVAFAPDGKTLASVSGSGVRIWDVATHKELRNMDGSELEGPRGWQRPVAFSPDGRTLAAGGADHSIRLWEAATGILKGQLLGHTKAVNTIAFSPDGKSLVSGADGKDSTVRLWDVVAQKELRRWRATDSGINGVAFSPRGDVVAAGGADGTIRLYDVDNGKERSVLRCSGKSDARVTTLAFSPDGKSIAAGSGRLVRRWDLATGKERVPEGHQDEVAMAKFTPDGKVLASVGQDGAIVLWDVAGKKEIHHLLGHESVTALAIGLKGGKLASAGSDGTIRLWDLATGKEAKRLAAHTGPVESLAVSADGTMLASGGWQDHTVRLWDAATGVERVGIPLPKPHGPNSGNVPIAFSPSGKVMVTGSADRSNNVLYFWDTATGKEIRHVPGPGGGNGSVAFSPDGETIAVAWGEKVCLLDASTGREYGQLVDGGNAGSTLAFSPDGRVLVAAGDSGRPTLRLWELSSMQVFAARGDRNTGFNSVVFSPDGRTLASAGRDTTILLWDVAALSSGTEMQVDRVRSAESSLDDLAATDVPRARHAVWALIAAPEQALPLLDKRIKAVVAPEKLRLDRLVADLDSAEFAVRDRAAKELEELAELAAPALRRVVKDSASAEVREHAAILLEGLEGAVSNKNQLRSIRAVEVLEHIGTPAALAVLERWSKGAPAARLSQEAGKALKRLSMLKQLMPPATDPER